MCKLCRMKRMKKILLAGLLLPLLAVGGTASAAENTSAPSATAQSQKLDPAQMFKHINTQYNYLIFCPRRPNVVVSAATFYGDPTRKGEVLIFENEDYNVKKAWAILKNDAEGQDLPDFNTLTPENAPTILDNMKKTAGYEGIALINITADNKGVFAVTGREIEIDTDGDGKPDVVAKADNQVAKLFFRGNLGNRYLIELIDNPIPHQESVAEFQQCVGSFHEFTDDERQKMLLGAAAGTGTDKSAK